jgi:hypothetical protein
VSQRSGVTFTVAWTDPAGVFRGHPPSRVRRYGETAYTRRTAMFGRAEFETEALGYLNSLYGAARDAKL